MPLAFHSNLYAIGQSSFYNLPNSIKKKAETHSKLVGKTLVNQPVRVKGKAGLTVVSGVIAINSTSITSHSATASIIEIDCPTYGSTVIVSNISVINHGLIQSVSNTTAARAAAVSINCRNNLKPKVIVEKSIITNNGLIRSIGR